MKIKYLISFIFSLIFIGCYSTYSIKNFSSKEKFYEDFNNFAQNKSLKIVFKNESSISIDKGAMIENDILYSLGQRIDTSYSMITALVNIEEIKYTSADYKSADILLKDGRRLKTENIQMLKDSIKFTVISRRAIKTNISSINLVKEISYKNRWTGIGTGLFFGTVIGIASSISSAFWYGYEALHSKPITYTYPGPIYYITVSGIGIGILAGWLLGNNWTYEFNH